MTLDRFIYWTLPWWYSATWPWGFHYKSLIFKVFIQNHSLNIRFHYLTFKVLWPWPSGDSMTQACLRCYDMIFIRVYDLTLKSFCSMFYDWTFTWWCSMTRPFEGFNSQFGFAIQEQHQWQQPGCLVHWKSLAKNSGTMSSSSRERER